MREPSWYFATRKTKHLLFLPIATPSSDRFGKLRRSRRSGVGRFLSIALQHICTVQRICLKGSEREKPTHSGSAAAFVLEQLNCLKRSSCGDEAVCRCGLLRTGRSGGFFPAMALPTLRNHWPKHRHAPWHRWYNRRELPGKGIRGSIE